ncbi:ATP synthase subunit O, mitochondrial [Plasmodiophora brassicae]|uniref:ATP synthase subunit O, mitochondrial n=1 Tax=Plasmodiophora brassicae TaxID=37360 RepID=A0A0G4IPD9_PLABS|nr:hypothetical protein PBRA_005676 [Plasmodiophora brassicae]SPR01052.1 unnamed protein product [Plasmodiophora brassicae]
MPFFEIPVTNFWDCVEAVNVMLRRLALAGGRRWASGGAVAQPPIQLFGVGGRYAHALFNVAQKENAVDRVNDELAQLTALSRSNENFNVLLNDPTVGKGEKKKLVTKLFEKSGVHQTTLHFLETLAENGRLPDLNTIVASYGQLVDAFNGEVKATVTTAKPITDQERKSLQDVLSKHLEKGQHLVLDMKVDPKIIGGIVVDLGDKMLDLSVSSRIDSIRNYIQNYTL